MENPATGGCVTDGYAPDGPVSADRRDQYRRANSNHGQTKLLATGEAHSFKLSSVLVSWLVRKTRPTEFLQMSLRSRATAYELAIAPLTPA